MSTDDPRTRSPGARIARLPIDDREAVEERAAILEYDGERPRRMAEHAALRWHAERQRVD